MKKSTKRLVVSTTLFMALASQSLSAGNIYCSPDGKGNGSSASSPTSVASAIKAVAAGDTVFLLEGNYLFTAPIIIDENNNGKEGKFKTVKPYNGASVVFDYSGMKVDGANRGIVLDGDFWYFYGFTIASAGDNGMLLSGNNNRIELMVFEKNQDTGLQISRYKASNTGIASWPSYNLILNCTARNNIDDLTMENADGFAAKLTCGEGNVFDGCMSYNNSDDGWDLYAKEATGPTGVVTLKNCVAFRNGFTEDGRGYGDCDGNGFKLGGGGVGSAHVVDNCLAFENLHCGFTDNNNPKLGSVSNATAVNNNYGSSPSNPKADGSSAKYNFFVYRCTQTTTSFKNNMSYYTGGVIGKIGSDKFEGEIENSVWCYGSGKYYQVDSKSKISNGSKVGSLLSGSPKDSDFRSVSVPALGTDFHKAWRNADGSVNTGGLYETAESGSFASMGYHFGSSVPVSPSTPSTPSTPEADSTSSPSTPGVDTPSSPSSPVVPPTTPQQPDVDYVPETPVFSDGDIYCSPDGTGDGKSEASPTDVISAINSLAPGHTIFLLSGTYSFDEPIIINEANCGSKGNLKTIMAAPGAKVVFDFSSMPLDGANRGFTLDGDYWHFKGFTIFNAGDNGMLLSGNNNVIELMLFDGNRDTGLQISRYKTTNNDLASWPSNNLVLNCTARNNIDEATMENADGFAAKLTCGEGNVFDGCMSYNNSDDGWDLFAKTATGPIGVVTLKNCLAFRNGYTEDGRGTADCDGNGFKLGGSGVGSAHVVYNCLAFENLHCGFTDNNNPKLGSITNCTAYNNNYGAVKFGSSDKINFSVYRCTSPGCDFKNIMSFSSALIKSPKNDKFVGTFENGVYYNAGYYQSTEKVSVTNGAKIGAKFAAADAPSAADFYNSTELPHDAKTDFHTLWRRADGSLNPKGIYETDLKGRFATMGYHMVSQEYPSSAEAVVSDVASGQVVSLVSSEVSDVLSVIPSLSAGNAVCYIFSADGRVMLSSRSALQAGSALQFNTSAFAPGVYSLAVFVNGQKSVVKFVVK